MNKYKWTVEFEIDETWVIDGFRLTDEVAKDMIETLLGWSYPYETSAKVVKKPVISKTIGMDVIKGSA